MTNLDKLISGRRSIRKYKQEPIPEEWIKAMILAAMKAPSPSNSQPVRFIHIRSSEAKTRLHKDMQDGRENLLKAITDTGSPKRLRNLVNVYWRFSEFMFHAPVLLAVGASLRSLSLAERLDTVGVREQAHKKHRDIDIAVGLALKGFLLKGEELRLGSCILTAPLIFIGEPEKILAVERTEIKCFITTGYPDEEPAYIKRRDIADIYREV